MACRYCSRCHQVALFCRTKLSSPLPLGIYERLLLPMLNIYLYAMPSQVGRTVPLWRDISSPKIGSHLSLFPSPSLFRMMCDGVFGYGTPPIACPLRCPSSPMMFRRQVLTCSSVSACCVGWCRIDPDWSRGRPWGASGWW